MPTILFVVKVTIRPQQEAAFNAWYSGEHVPQMLQFPGVASACASPTPRCGRSGRMAIAPESKWKRVK